MVERNFDTKSRQFSIIKVWIMRFRSDELFFLTMLNKTIYKQYQVSDINEASHKWSTDETDFNGNKGKVCCLQKRVQTRAKTHW